MTLSLSVDDATRCTSLCRDFAKSLTLEGADKQAATRKSAGAFDTDVKLSAAYSTLLNEDLETLFKGFATQADAMAVLFARSAGMISEADKDAERALRAAAAQPAPISSPGMFSELAGAGGSLSGALGGATGGAIPLLAHFTPVGPQPTDGLDLDAMGTAAEALSPSDYHQAATTLDGAATTLETATNALYRGLEGVLNSSWLGATAEASLETVRSFRKSADLLVADLRAARDGASGFADAATVTRTRIAEQVAAADRTRKESDTADANRSVVRTVWQALTPTDEHAKAVETGREAAREQSAHVINTEYNPGLGRGDLARRSFTTAFQVVAGGAGKGDGIGTFDWNSQGTTQTAPVTQGGWEKASATSTSTSAEAGAGHPAGTTGGAGATSGTGDAPTGVGAARDADTTTAVNARGTESGTAAGPDPTRASAANPSTTTASTTGTGGAGMAAPIGGTAGPAAGGARSGSASSRPDRRATGYDTATPGLGGAAVLAGAGTLAGLGANGLGSSTGSGAGTGAGAGLRGAAPVPTPGATGSGTSTGARPSMGGAGMMHGAHGQHGERKTGHKPASYLVHATNTNEIIGDLPKVSPAVLGAPPLVDDTRSDQRGQSST